MGKTIPLTEEMRDELVLRWRQGHSLRQLAHYFKVSPSTIGRWIVRDDVAVFLEENEDELIFSPAVHFYRGFAVDDYAKLSRYAEVAVYRLKSGEQVRIKDFNLREGTASCERFRSWHIRRLASYRDPARHGGTTRRPWITIPVDALTLNYEILKGDLVYLDGESVQIKEVVPRNGTVLLEGRKSGEEIPIDVLCNSRWEKEKAKARRYLESGHFKARLGDFRGAWQDFSRATTEYHGFIETHISTGVAATKLHGEGAGIGDYRAAISLGPDDAAAYFERCASDYRLTTNQKQDFEIAACYNQYLPEYMQFRPEEAKPIFEAALTRAEQEGNQRLKGQIEEWIRELFPQD